MAARYMLDTNICIHVRQKRPAQVLERFAALAWGEAVISIITYGELVFGAEKSANRSERLRYLADLTAFIPVLPISQASGETYGVLRFALGSKGQLIGNNDLWIAAHARSEGLILVTNNAGEFSRVPGLQIENWAN